MNESWIRERNSEEMALNWARRGVSWEVSPSPRTVSRVAGQSHSDPRRLEGPSSGTRCNEKLFNFDEHKLDTPSRW